MLKRLIVGLFLGAVIGGIAAAAVVQGLKFETFDASAFGATVAYLSAAATGLVTGLVAGKPIWSADGKIEAGLKAFFGALLALGAMFVLRQWVHASIDLSSIKAGSGELGHLPATSLPVIAALLAGFFELDNSDPPKEDARDAAKAGASSKVRVASAPEEEEADEEEEPAAAKKRRRS